MKHDLYANTGYLNTQERINTYKFKAKCHNCKKKFYISPEEMFELKMNRAIRIYCDKCLDEMGFLSEVDEEVWWASNE